MTRRRSGAQPCGETAYGWRLFLARPVWAARMMSGRMGAVKTAGRAHCSTASPSRPWTVTRGRAAAMASPWWLARFPPGGGGNWRRRGACPGPGPGPRRVQVLRTLGFPVLLPGPRTAPPSTALRPAAGCHRVSHGPELCVLWPGSGPKVGPPIGFPGAHSAAAVLLPTQVRRCRPAE